MSKFATATPQAMGSCPSKKPFAGAINGMKIGCRDGQNRLSGLCWKVICLSELGASIHAGLELSNLLLKP